MEINTLIWILVSIGLLIGLGGGIYGTYSSIKNSKTEKEKQFIIRSSIPIWLFMILFLLCLMLIPQPYNFLLWVPYGIVFPFGLRYFIKKHRQIRNED